MRDLLVQFVQIIKEEPIEALQCTGVLLGIVGLYIGSIIIFA